MWNASSAKPLHHKGIPDRQAGLPHNRAGDIQPCMRFSRTRLTDALHRRRSTGARQGRFGLGATTIPFRETSPSSSRDPKTWANPQARPRLCRLARNSATRITAWFLILSNSRAESESNEIS